ncbi:MAG: hypothetical protein ABI442_02870 [Gemmatimonadaceae bacterium]
MSRLIFAALTSACIVNSAAAQRVAGRDLLDFPIGLAGEAPALSSQMTAGLWNPATSALDPGVRGAFGVAGLSTPQEQGVRLVLLGASYRLHDGLTASVSLGQASVSDILLTGTDPQSLGSDVAYGTKVISTGLSGERKNVRFGLAGRYRSGVLDTDHSSGFSLDGGAIVDRLAGTPVRLALSTFLLTPWRKSQEATYMAAADVPLVARDSIFVVRGGYSMSRTAAHGHEEYAFATSSYGPLDISGGLLQSTIFGSTSHKWRLGCGLRYASYTVAVGREDGAAGLPGSFQFLLTRTVR